MFENTKIPSELKPSDARFGVGPSLILQDHVQKLADMSPNILGVSHRSEPVINLCAEMQAGIKKYFNLPAGYEVIMGNGGATFLFDMIGLGLVKKSSLHYVCGEFSNKWFLAHENIPSITAKKIEVKYGTGINPEFDANYDMICATLNETSTGVIFDELPTCDENTLMAVDATSGAGQVELDFNKVDLYFFSPQKVFSAEGGFYIAIMSPKALRRAEELEDSGTYRPIVMSWKNAIENSLKHQTYNTPCVSNIFLLNEQVKLMNTLGEKKVIELARKKAELMYSWAESKEYLTCFVEEKKFRSHCVATINVDDKYPVGELAKFLRENHLAYDIEAYRKLGLNQLRISMFHNVSYENLEKLTKIITLAIETAKG